ncbi:MAG: toll/interleukin-1 receptor domain-containing protein, partial [Proteobacteria bacterium]|nr:toll/interleukin-1 receptor domain-containing protein [Pseudomonadota bacterium]
MPTPTPTRAVFLSYASQDAEPARRLSAALRAAGVEVWFDQSELRGGDVWDAKIRQQIRTCSLFMPVLSRHSQARAEGYFRLEWKLAIDRSHLIAADRAFLVPVVVDDTTEASERVPERFREVQWIRVPGGEPPPDFVQQV